MELRFLDLFSTKIFVHVQCISNVISLLSVFLTNDNDDYAAAADDDDDDDDDGDNNDKHD